MEIILGSQSPRRRELLKALGFDFTTVSIECDETYPEMDPAEIAEFLADKKSNQYSNLKSNQLLICADTIVVINGLVLNKPCDVSEAESMLQTLSNKWHQVYTGLCLRTLDEKICLTELTEVFVEELDEKDIAYYIQKCRPFDKAGSYGIQEWLGLAGISKIKGCYYNVMGLPTSRLYATLKDKFGLRPD